MDIFKQVIIVVTVPGFWPAVVSIVTTGMLYGAIINGNPRRLLLWLLPLIVFPFLSDALHASVLHATGVSSLVSPYVVAGIVALISFVGAMFGGLLTSRQERRATARRDQWSIFVEQVVAHR